MTTSKAIWDAITQQGVFRRVLEATAYPGSVLGIEERPAWLALLAALLDSHTTLADPDNLIGELETSYLGAPEVSVENAEFVIIDASKPAPKGFALRRGDLSNPERGATLILVGEALGDKATQELVLRGPGIRGQTTLKLNGFDASWFVAREAFNAEFPTGVDFILATQGSIACLPRTTVIEEQAWVT